MAKKSEVSVVDLAKEEYARIFDKLVDIDEPLAWIGLYNVLRDYSSNVEEFVAQRRMKRGYQN